MVEAYATLPFDVRSLVTGRNAVHGSLPAPSAPLEDAPAYDPGIASRRPLVVDHWRTGTPVLYLPKHPHSTIDGLPEDEGRAVLAHLWAHTAACSARFEAVLHSGEVVVWDNIRAVHTNPPYPRDRDRTVWFFLIPGDHELTATCL